MVIKHKMPKDIRFSDLPGIIISHPMGLIVGILLFAILLIFGGVFACIFKILIRLPFNLDTPNKILAGGICDPDKMIRVKAGEWIINLFQLEWFIYFVLIGGVVIYVYFQYCKK